MRGQDVLYLFQFFGQFLAVIQKICSVALRTHRHQVIRRGGVLFVYQAYLVCMNRFASIGDGQLSAAAGKRAVTVRFSKKVIPISDF